MDLNLKNKVILVTGGSKGIGLGISKMLSEEGAIPVIIGRNKESVLKAVSGFEKRGQQAYYALAELTNPNECKNAVQRIIKKFGSIDGLVNNAGLNDGVGLENGNYEDFIISIKRNVAHYYYMAHLVLPYLKKSKGSIVNIGSKTSVTGQGGTSGYAASNGGRDALTREWAIDLLPYSIRVNAVIVAECYTPQYKNWIKKFPNPEETLKEITKHIPLENRMTSVEEIANTVVFLLSEKSSHTTGQLLFVDGGYTHLDRSL
ncbi:MAG: SDR family oxidoreductase [Flavobacteriaceae bacterium]|nr:SDR family oxidoreductase [Flavobacteriaceae bacterium]